jgi:predicted DNA-binding protein with PD1-like motif
VDAHWHSWSKKEVFMKKVVNLPVFLILLATVGCQQAQSDKNTDMPCPAVHTTEGDFDRVVVVRLKSGTDVLEGLKEAVKKEKIKNAVILSGIGSVTQYHFHVVSNTSFPTTNTFVKKDAPADLLNMNGYIFDGRVHAHLTISNDKEAIGGHLEDDTRVFTFAIITLGVLDDRVNMQRFDDSSWR